MQLSVGVKGFFDDSGAARQRLADSPCIVVVAVSDDQPFSYNWELRKSGRLATQL